MHQAAHNKILDCDLTEAQHQLSERHHRFKTRIRCIHGAQQYKVAQRFLSMPTQPSDNRQKLRNIGEEKGANTIWVQERNKEDTQELQTQE